MNDLYESIEKLFKLSKYCDGKITIRRYSRDNDDNAIEIKVSQMYKYVDLNFYQLMGLSKIFGTECIDVDNYSYAGCDTCDYGSSYIKTIQIWNITKNLDVVKAITETEVIVEDK